MATTPTPLTLANVADGAPIVASDHRNNYSSVQTAVNALITILAAGTTGQVVLSSGGTTVGWTYPSGYEVAYQAYATDQTTASVAYADLFTFAAATFENTKYYLEIAIPNLRASIATDAIQFRLMEGATPIGEAVTFETHQTVGVGVSAFYRMPFTPSAASHTYKIQWMTVFAATATIKATVGDATFRIVKA